MKHIKHRNEFLNESHITNNGDIEDINWNLTSDDYWSDEEFISICEDALNYGDEMPSEMYDIISDKHKKIYREVLLKYAVEHTENGDVIDDLIKYEYDEFVKAILDYIKMYSTFGNDHFPISMEIIKRIDEIFQGLIIKKFISEMQYPINIDKDEFNCFTENIQDYINKHPGTFVVEGVVNINNIYNFTDTDVNMLSDADFSKICDNLLNFIVTIPISVYQKLSESKKRIYCDSLLSNIVVLFDCDEPIIIKDIIKHHNDEFRSAITEWLDIFPDLGIESFPFSPSIIKLLDESTQKMILDYIYNKLDYDLEFNKDVIKAFTPNNKKFINKYLI